MVENLSKVEFAEVNSLPQYSGALEFFTKLINRKAFGNPPKYTEKVVLFMLMQKIVRPLLLASVIKSGKKDSEGKQQHDEFGAVLFKVLKDNIKMPVDAIEFLFEHAEQLFWEDTVILVAQSERQL